MAVRGEVSTGQSKGLSTGRTPSKQAGCVWARNDNHTEIAHVATTAPKNVKMFPLASSLIMAHDKLTWQDNDKAAGNRSLVSTLSSLDPALPLPSCVPLGCSQPFLSLQV